MNGGMNPLGVNASALAELHARRIARHRARRRVNRVALTLSVAAMSFGLFWLAWILVETIRLGVGGTSLALFTEMTPPPLAESGGLANAIFGSLAMVALATLVLWVGIARWFNVPVALVPAAREAVQELGRAPPAP